MSRILRGRSLSLARSLTLPLVVAAACSRGGAPSGDDPPPGADGDLGAAADLAAPPDLTPARPGFLKPAWVWTLQGGLITWGPYLTALPPAGETGAADLLLTFTKGYEADDLVVGMGDPGQTLVQGKFMPVLAWLGAGDGAVRRVRQVAGKAPDRPGTALPMAPASVGAGGEISVIGQFANGVTFNPGSGAAQPQNTETRLYNGTAHRAEDPYLARYGADGAPGWLFRGRTPGPLTTTWFNYGQAVAALPDGGAAIAGVYEAAGFNLGDNRPGALTFAAGPGGYVARVTPQGGLAWALRSQGFVHYWRGLRSAPDGSVYVLAQQGGDVVFAADSFKLALPVPAGGRVVSVIKLGPGGELRWARRFVTPKGTSGPQDVAVAADGDLIVAGGATGELTVRGDGDALLGTVPTVAGSETRGFAARLSPEGDLRFVIALGAGVDGAGMVAPAPGGDAWVLGLTTGQTRSVPLEGGATVALPDGLGADASVTLLYRLSAAGRRSAAYVLGANLPVNGLVALPDGGVAVTGGYGDWAPPLIGGDGAAPRELPPCTSSTDQRLFVLALRPGR